MRSSNRGIRLRSSPGLVALLCRSRAPGSRQMAGKRSELSSPVGAPKLACFLLEEVTDEAARGHPGRQGKAVKKVSMLNGDANLAVSVSNRHAKA